jgi:hypothetical protein
MVAQPILWIDGANGIYVPKRFVNVTITNAIENVTEETLTTLENGPGDDNYWDAWETVLDTAMIRETFFDPTKPDVFYFLHQSDDGDVWLIPRDMEWNEETEWFSYPNEEVKEEME